MDISCIIFGTLFTAVGFLFFIGRLHTHLNEWRDMPQEEKDRINILPLVRNIGAVIMLCGVIFLIKGFVESFEGKGFAISMIAWFILAGVDLWHISNSSRYQK